MLRMDLEATHPPDTEEPQATARPRVRAAAEALEKVQALLQEVAATLPALDDEVSLRSVIECVLVDSLQPAIRDLRAAVGRGE